MKFTLLPEAEEELLEAILHLNAREERLGLELAAEEKTEDRGRGTG